MTENKYRATITEWIDPDYHTMSQYNVKGVGFPSFECEIETNDLDLLNELTKVLMDFAEQKRNELKEYRGEDE